VKHEPIVKSFKRCNISDSFDGTENDVLSEESEISGNNNNNNNTLFSVLHQQSDDQLQIQHK